MTKKIKKPAQRATKAQIEKAAKSIPIRDMAKLANAFVKVGIEENAELQLPLHCTVNIKDKGYRKTQLRAGLQLAPSRIYLGKKNGLIFVFETTCQVKCNKGDVESCEVLWSDVINFFGDFADKVEYLYKDSEPETDTIDDMEHMLKSAIDKNPAMHSVLAKGFAKVQEDANRYALRDDFEGNEIFGLF